MTAAPAPGDAGQCPVCGEELADRPLTRCPHCETPHHSECWDFCEGCAIYACEGSLVVLLRRAEEATAELPVLVEDDDHLREAMLSPLVRAAQVPGYMWRLIGGWLFFLAALTWLAAAQPGAPGFLATIPLPLAFVGAVLSLSARALPIVFEGLVSGLHRPALPDATPTKELEARLADDPENVHLLELLAHTHAAEGAHERALELYEKALDLRPRHLGMRFRRGQTLERLGRTAEARAELEAVAAQGERPELADRARWWLEALERRADEAREPSAFDAEPPTSA